MAGIGYAFISAYLKGEEAKILSSEHINTVIKSENIQDVIDSIRETDIGSYLEGLDIATFDEVDEQLWHYFNDSLFPSIPQSQPLLNTYVTPAG